MSATFAELVVLAALVWLIARLLEPLRRRLERILLRLLDPEAPEIVDAEIQPGKKKSKE